jgi:hypothetical protein
MFFFNIKIEIININNNFYFKGIFFHKSIFDK